MSETIKTLLEQELQKLEPQRRDELQQIAYEQQTGIELAVENRLSGMGIRMLVPKKATFNPERGITEYRGEIDMNGLIEQPHVEEVRRYIAETIKEELENPRYTKPKKIEGR